jgi:hypothetical protein
MNDPNVICIYHINSRYLFKIEDLLKLIYTSLTNGSSFFSEPITIKNPYNNMPFGKSILYHIYFFLVSNANIQFINLSHLDIFFKFKECNFNMTNFINDFEYLLREYMIKNYINNSTKENLKGNVFQIIKEFNFKFKNIQRHIFISDEFPTDDLIRIFKPYIHLKLTSIYSLIKQKKYESEKKLYKKLREFQEYNPQFGRKIIKFKDIIKNGKLKKIKSHIEFNMKYKKFNNDDVDKFMTNHLVYKYDGYSSHDDDDDDTYSEEEHQTELILITETLINSNLTSVTNYSLINNITQYEEQEEEEEQEEPYYNEEDEENEEDSIS